VPTDAAAGQTIHVLIQVTDNGAGLFHSANLHIVERFTRKGDEILYEITVEDPDVLVEPWVREPRTLRLNPAADAGLVAERAHCEIYEESSLTTQLRH
jgi:hypothetical protein